MKPRKEPDTLRHGCLSRIIVQEEHRKPRCNEAWRHANILPLGGLALSIGITSCVNCSRQGASMRRIPGRYSRLQLHIPYMRYERGDRAAHLACRGLGACAAQPRQGNVQYESNESTTSVTCNLGPQSHGMSAAVVVQRAENRLTLLPPLSCLLLFPVLRVKKKANGPELESQIVQTNTSPHRGYRRTRAN